MLRFGTLLGILATACSSSGPTLPYSDLDRALQQARCERDTRCGLFPDEESCLRFARIRPDDSLAAAVEAAVVGYDGERAQQCIDATAKQSCDRNTRNARVAPSACTTMLTGTLAGGASCSFDLECESRACELPANCPETGCCVGTCLPPSSGSLGTDCRTPTDCDDGLVCATDKQCRPPSDETELCNIDPQCAEGLACVGQTRQMPGRCRPLPHAGEPCPYQRCADDNLRCNDANLCVELGMPGTPCPLGIECASGFECDSTTQQCREYPTLGMECNTACSGDAFCYYGPSSIIGTCTAPLENTTPCDGYNQCASFYCEQGPLFDSCKDQYICF